MTMNSHVTMENGVLRLDGKPMFVWSADYPYYRDQRADWPRQLDSLKKMNVQVVTFYIPWRHHAPTDPLHGGGGYDFRGRLNDRTDVLEFIRLIRERGLYCIVKPGPYIHAETRFGSLPDYVLPQNNPEIRVRVDMQGNESPACWGFSNPPGPMEPAYLPYVRDWFRAVAREVIRPNEYPTGPILAVQVLNEGVYSDGGYGVDKVNFEASAVARYREFLGEKYGDIAAYNERCGTSFAGFSEIPPPKPWAEPAGPKAIRPALDWAEFGQHFYRLIASTYIGYLREEGMSLPVVMNINPPASPRGAGLETVMGRYTVPYLSPVIQYGYTNWCGVVSHNPDSWLKYKMIGKQARGINMEENWGFDSYDPPYYWSVQPSLFQSLAYMLWGATGLNIYLGVSCDCWTDSLAVDAGGVYMHNHPIAEDGSYRAAFWTCAQLGALVRRIGPDLVGQALPEPVAWGLYSPYAHAASWDSAPGDWKKIGFPDRPHAAWFGWDSFMALCDRNKTQNGVSYPREEPVERLLRHPILFLDGNAWMDAATQAKLVDYVERGGVLVLTTDVPELDEFFRPCTVLKDKLFPCRGRVAADDGGFKFAIGGGAFKGAGRGRVLALEELGEGLEPLATAKIAGHTQVCGTIRARGKGRAILLGFSPWQTESGEWGSAGLVEHLAREYAGVRVTATVAPEPPDPLVETADFPCDARGRRYVYVLTRRDKPAVYTVRMNRAEGAPQSFELKLPAYSGALVGFENGRIAAAFIKGWNDLDKSSAAPRLSFEGGELRAADPCDLYFSRLDDGGEVSVTNIQNEKGQTSVSLPLGGARPVRVVQVTSTGREIEVPTRVEDGCVTFTAADMRRVEAPAVPGEWNPHYRVVTTG